MLYRGFEFQGSLVSEQRMKMQQLHKERPCAGFVCRHHVSDEAGDVYRVVDASCEKNSVANAFQAFCELKYDASSERETKKRVRALWHNAFDPSEVATGRLIVNHTVRMLVLPGEVRT